MTTIQSIKDLLTDKFYTTELPFITPIKIKLSPHHELASITAISIDGNGRLRYRSNSGIWSEIHDELMYKNHILGSINQRLCILLMEKTSTPIN